MAIRVYSGLMDMMSDNEVEGVLGHEMATSRSATRKAMQVLSRPRRHAMLRRRWVA